MWNTTLQDYGQCIFTCPFFCSSVICSWGNTLSQCSPPPELITARVAHADWTGAMKIPASASPYTFPLVCTTRKIKRHGVTEDLFFFGCCQQVVSCKQPDLCCTLTDWMDAGRIWTTRDSHHSSPCLCGCSWCLQLPDCKNASPLVSHAWAFQKGLAEAVEDNLTNCAQIHTNGNFSASLATRFFKQSFQETF